MKRLLSLLLALAMVLSFAGCGTTSSTSKEETIGDEKTTVTVDVDLDQIDPESALPVIFINAESEIGDEQTDALMKIVDQFGTTPDDQLYEGAITIKWRGNSTKYRAKHPYKIKLDEKTDLFGMGKGKHWVLLANDLDHTQIRNQITLDFARAIGMENSSNSKLVTLVLNGEYQGVYELAEHVRVGSSYVDIYDWDDTFGEIDPEGNPFPKNAEEIEAEQPQTGGFLLEADFYRLNDGRLEGTELSETYLNDPIWQTDDVITDYYQPFYFNSPVGVGCDTELWQYANNYIQAFEYALHSDDFTYHADQTYMKPANMTCEFEGSTAVWHYDEVPSDFHCEQFDGWHYSDFFDVDSLVNYFFVCELTMNWDSMKNSTFLYKDIEGKAYMGPVWDYDWGYGNICIETDYVTDTWRLLDSFYIAGEDTCFFQSVQWYMYLLKDPEFVEKVYNRYHEIRDTEIQQLIDSVYEYETKLEYDGLKNDALWDNGRYNASDNPEESFSEYSKLPYKEAYAFLEQFLSDRMTWLDAQFTSLDTLTDSLNRVNTVK